MPELKQGTRYKLKLPPRRELRGARAPLTQAPETQAPESPFPEGMQLSPPPDWGEYAPISLQAETGEKIQAWVKPDRTVWRGKDQIGSLDEYDRFIPRPPTTWEQFGQAGEEMALGAVKGLSYLFKPFEYFHEYVGVPITGMGPTAAFWQKTWWESKTPEEQRELIAKGYQPGMLAAESVGDFFKQWFSKEGEFRKAYHEWDAPKYLRGTLELIPWFFLPAIGQVGKAGVAARGIAGKLGRISPQLGKAVEYSPYGLLEKGITKAAGKVVEYPIKVGGKVVRRLRVTRRIEAPAPPPVEEVLASVAREHPERLRPFRGIGKGALTTAQQEKLKLAKEAETTFRKVEVLRNEDRLIKESSVPSLMSHLVEKGDEATLFGLKEVAIPKTKLTHELVTAPGIKPKVKGASMALDDVLANPSKYEWSGLKGKQARLWAEQYYELQNTMSRFWDEFIQRPIGRKPGEQYVHSLVTARRNPLTGATILEKQMYPAGTRGGITGAAKPLKFSTQIEGIEAGFKYARPTQALAMQIEEYYNMTTFKRAMSLIDDLFQDPMERMNKEIADTMRQYISDIKFLGGGITRITTKEGKVIIEKHPGVRALIQSVRRGEVPTAGMVGAVERRFPELGAGLRDALDIKYLEIDQALKGISEAIFKDTKVTRAKFREMLAAVRAKMPEKPLAKVVPESIEKRQAEITSLLEKPGKLPAGVGTKEGLKIELAGLEAQRSISVESGMVKGDTDLLARRIVDTVSDIEQELGSRSMPYHGAAPVAYSEWTSKQLDEMLRVYRQFLAGPKAPDIIKYKTAHGVTLKETREQALARVEELEAEIALAGRRLAKLKETQKKQPGWEAYDKYIDEKVGIDIRVEEQEAVLGMLKDEVGNIQKALAAPIAEVAPAVAKAPVAKAVKDQKILPTELTETLDRLGVEAGKQVRFLSQLYRQTYKQTNEERAQALRQLLKDVDSQIIGLKAEAKAFAPQFKLARQEAINTAFSEGRIITLAGYANKIIPDKTEWGMTGREISDKLIKILTPEKVNVALRKAAGIARAGVTLTAALDLSLMFIQGGLVLGHDVARWATFRKSSAFYNMAKEMVKAIWNPKYQDEFISKNFAVMKEMAENRAVIQKAVEYMRPGDIEHFIRQTGEAVGAGKIGNFFGGVFKQSYGRFGAGFGSGSLAARTTMYRQMREVWLREGHSLPQLGEFVNKTTGVISSAELGVSATQRAVESAVLFAPNYTRAYIMVVRDLFRGTKTASEVRKAMAGMLAGGVVAYVALAEMMGQEPKLNPAPKSLGGDGAEFMSFKIANSIIGVPGFWYSAFRMMAWVVAAAEEKPEALLSLDWRENPTLKFLMGRSSPLVAIGREIVEQKDFLGRRLDEPDDWMRTMSMHFLTIAAQNLWTRDPSEEEGRGKRFGAEIFGLRAFPRGDWSRLEDMENEYAQREFQKPFDDLNREEKDKILDKYPEYKAFSEEARDKMVWESGEDFEHWTLAAEKMADSEYHAIGEQLARSLFTGLIDYRTYLDEESTLRKIYQGKAKERQLIESLADPEQAERYAKWAELRPTEDQTLDKYWQIRNDLKRLPTGQIDWDHTESRVNEYLDSLNSETRNYVLRMKDRRLRDLPPMMQKIARLQSEGREIVDEYYDQPEGKARILYRRTNPTVDAWLLVMGRVSVPRTEIAMQLAMEMLQQRGLPLTLVSSLAEGAVAGVTAPAPTLATGRRPITMRVRRAQKVNWP